MSNVVRSSKMSSSEGGIRFLSNKDLLNTDPGVLVEGTFTGKNEKPGIAKDGRKFTSVTYFFETDSGEKIGINKLGNLQHVLEKSVNIQVGERAIIEYDGMQNGYHTFNASIMG